MWCLEVIKHMNKPKPNKDEEKKNEQENNGEKNNREGGWEEDRSRCRKARLVAVCR